jgi:protocatechuate 3,4-dioxygenase beta subunit
MNINRRKFIVTGAAGSLAVAGPVLGTPQEGTALSPTPKEIKGPFYPVIAQKDKDFDLTQIEGQEGVAKGRHIFIVGEVCDTTGAFVEDATIDIWQANAAGKYRHPHDQNPAPLDDNFQGWAIVPSGKDGSFRFKSVFPGAYPAADGWTRPPHIHFKVTKMGYVELMTQMYFPGEALNATDLLLKKKSDDEKKLMVSEKTSADPETYHYKIVIQKAG